VLVVDDNATNLRILAAQLEHLGVAVTPLRSPTEALAAAAKPGAFDAVVSDLRMPETDGLEIAAAIRSALGEAAPPVIVLSSAGHRERDAAGVAAFLTKPVKPAALRDTLAGALGGAIDPAPRPAERVVAGADLGARHPLRVLLAEDNAVNQKLALRLLERMGYAADVALDGAEAIAALDGTEYDIVLMDVQMPELDGLEATRRIRERWPERSLRIVAMTANAMEGDRETCLAAGMDDYLSKPIRPDELAAALLATPGRADESVASGG
jgi:CheY-like chemotaxis protein